MPAVAWLEFWAKLTPEVLKLGRSIYDAVEGDPEKGIAEIRRIRSHAIEWFTTRDANTKRLEEAGIVEAVASDWEAVKGDARAAFRKTEAELGMSALKSPAPTTTPPKKKA